MISVGFDPDLSAEASVWTATPLIYIARVDETTGTVAATVSVPAGGGQCGIVSFTGLEPGVTYLIQGVSVSGGLTSDWSKVIGVRR